MVHQNFTLIYSLSIAISCQNSNSHHNEVSAVRITRLEGPIGITNCNAVSPSTCTTYTIQNHSYLPPNALINVMHTPFVSYVNTIPPTMFFLTPCLIS